MSDIDEVARKFIVSKRLDEKQIEEMMQNISELCLIDENGFVILNEPAKKYNTKEKIFLILGARLIGSEFQRRFNKEITIQETISYEEISKILTTDKKIISARLSDLNKENKITLEAPGIYRVKIHELQKFLDKKVI